MSDGNGNGRVLPFDPNAEFQVIGTILSRNEAADEVASFLRPGDFSEPVLSRIFQVMLDLREEKAGIDRLIIQSAIRSLFPEYDNGLIDEFLDRAVRTTGEDVNVKYHAGIVKRHSWHRGIIKQVDRLRRDVGHADFEQVCDDAVSGARRLSELLDQAMQPETSTERQVQEAIHAVHHEDFWLPTGMEELDKNQVSLAKNCLNIVGARTSMGKTSFALNVLIHLCRLGLRVMYISPETKSKRAFLQLIAIISQLSFRQMKEGLLTEEIQQQVVGEISTWDMETRHESMTISQLLHTIRAKHRMKPFDLVIVDYLQVFGDSKEPMDQVIRGLVDIAEHDGVTILAVSQINREVEKRISKKANVGRPTMSDLQNSGTIEQAAEVVYLLWQPSYYGHLSYNIGGYDYPTDQLVEVIVAKQRMGRRNVSFPLRFIGPCYRFEPLYRADQLPPVADSHQSHSSGVNY